MDLNKLCGKICYSMGYNKGYMILQIHIYYISYVIYIYK